MSNVVEQLTPNPVTHEHGENGCGKNPRAWEMEMLHQVWAAGLHDAANCFQDALEAQRKVMPKTNGDRFRAMTDETLAALLRSCCRSYGCSECPICGLCNDTFRTEEDWLDWLRSPVEEGHE